MNRDLAALAFAPVFAGNTIFKLVPIGGKFRFGTAGETLTKTSAGWYQDAAGRKFRTGSRTAVYLKSDAIIAETA